ncbi:hypothetical protein Syun_029480 [Stephania yunnanensis]|uniref:Uncharacterized protein n=1 Tax=Stephania yunnanensis TaxID=152371 RepID=A0AAP0E5P7_9MAGN
MATGGATLDALMERLTKVEQGLAHVEVARNEVGEDDDPIILVQLDALERLGFFLAKRMEALIGDVSTLENQFRGLNMDVQAISVKYGLDYTSGHQVPTSGYAQLA